jgi:VanZ family protein
MEAILSRFLTNQPQLRLALKFLFIGLILTGIVVALIPMKGIDVDHFDKILHASAFFGFAFLLDMASPRSFWRWKAPLLLFYGASIEILQAFTPWRSFSVADFAADTLGVLLYWLLWYMVLKRSIAHPNG